MANLSWWPEKWEAFTASLASPEKMVGWGIRLQELYAEPHRAYHNLTHLEHCLTEWEPVKDLAQDPLALEFALWFHDAIYQPQQSNNEAASAQLALQCGRECGQTESWLSNVEKLIMATCHGEIPSGDGQVMVDIDLAILGQPPERYQQYEREIAQEYHWVPAEIFPIMRKQVVEGFLSRPAIYSTATFQNKYEEQARKNLQWSCDYLSTL